MLIFQIIHLARSSIGILVMDQFLCHLIQYHQYDSPGTYVVTLNILDDSNCGISQTSEIITVTNIEEISLSDIDI